MQFDPSEIKLIVGLGNPGKNYHLTRHNAGFMFVDKLLQQFEMVSDWSKQQKFQAEMSRIRIAASSPWLAKPATGMNISGRAVQLIANYYNLEPEEIAIAFDDLDIPLGKYKIQFGKGPKVHNGLSSVKKSLATDAFWNIRIGIENREKKGNTSIPGMSYALNNFAPSERDTLDEVFKNIIHVKLMHEQHQKDDQSIIRINSN